MFEDVTVVAVVREKKTFECGLHNHSSRKELNWCKESQARINNLMMELGHYKVHGTPMDIAIRLSSEVPEGIGLLVSHDRKTVQAIAIDERYVVE